MKILITGAGGQVASELVRENKDYKFNLFPFKRSSLDITNKNSIKNKFIQVQPDIVINAAAYTSVDEAEQEYKTAFQVNMQGIRNLAKFCKKFDIPLLHISTDYVFDGKLKRPYVETDNVNPLGVYGRSKHFGECELRKIMKKHIILRTSWVFGLDGNNFVKKILNLSQTNSELSIVSDQHGGPTSARAIAMVLLSLSQKFMQDKDLPWGTYHFCQLPHCSWYQFASKIIEQASIIKKVPKVKLNSISSETFNSITKRPQNSMLNPDFLLDLLEHKVEKYWLNDLYRVIEKIKN